MSSEFTPETERQRLQYLVRVLPAWRSAVASGMVPQLCWRNVLLLTWEQAHGSQTTYGINSPPHTPSGSHILAPCVTTHSTSVNLLLWLFLSHL